MRLTGLCAGYLNERRILPKPSRKGKADPYAYGKWLDRTPFLVSKSAIRGLTPNTARLDSPHPWAGIGPCQRS